MSRYPLLYQVNTRVWLTELAHQLKRPATLDDIPDAALDRWAAAGFDWIWLLSVWQTGAEGERISRTNPEWLKEFHETLPDLRDEDIPGSGFAITAYDVHANLGGDVALARLRARMKQRGLKLMLDFVPNHTGLDHHWVADHPEYYVPGTEQDLAREPQNYVRVKRQAGDLVLAYGRDPYFSGWPDTLQLNYGNPATQAALIGELRKIGRQCDGLRCDMAMLVLPDIFEKTWGLPMQPFWPQAIPQVRELVPGFCFMAEVYWDREWELQQQGFDYTYDKRLYDRLRDRHARPVREHFWAGLDYQNKLARFLENHDEPRAAATFPPGVHEAAAVITYLSPGLRFFHQGQFEGRLKRISPHLGRAPEEPKNEQLAAFYDRLLAALHDDSVRNGDWQLVECDSAWEQNETQDNFVVFAWQHSSGERRVVAVNYSDQQSQCLAHLPFGDLAGQGWQLRDCLSEDLYHWNGDDLVHSGLYLDMRPWQAAIYALEPVKS
ncbi:maltodextrin glucosidase [Anatilimnocola aggregata]|uniref:Maltodextrin glucosidase n=1 Tax=Anatilimnocola aggregata TaxID=2528021 RepID=A0A517YAA1_9BACT|nr:alpha-amylase family glycosyl hydrolase [Anatilimnocola aggregata]QDU27148.1 maltodextrin glucosidase [Anatilimnocola aggregata]